jgi:glycosyltransferase involved in cell wall biosynthesis
VPAPCALGAADGLFSRGNDTAGGGGALMIQVTQYLRRPRFGLYSIERLYEDVRSHLQAGVEVSTCISRYFSRGLLPRLYDMVRARRYQGDINHVTGDVHFLTFLLDKRRTVLTIHDCVLLERLHGVKRWILWLLWYWLPEKRCTAIVVVSEATKHQVLHYIRCDEKKIRVIHNPVSKEFQPRPRPFNRDEIRLVQIGTKANKNLERLATALAGLRCVLVVVGQLSASQEAKFRQHGISYENHVGISRRALVEQYERSDILVFVSTYEGFGLPIVEANAVGRPVVTGNIWSMPEIAGDAACLVDPFDVASIRCGILRLIEDDAYRKHLVERGFENVKRFRIETVAERYAELYRDVYYSSVTSY